MPTVTYDDRSFILDNRRIWLNSGAIHYFRTPRELWADRLLKAKRAGLNCIETYVAWNFHEPQEGKWDFAGDRDIRHFVTLAADMGLYVILRPGPYICSEWDFGGLPAWLVAKSGIAYRTANATFMHYFDKYLGQVLPRLADMQVTRGGNIILIQNENEYFYTPPGDRLTYCQFISQLIRRAGFDIPILTCNLFSEPRIPQTIECYNGYDTPVQSLKRLRTLQPDAPMLATEFWVGWFDFWDTPHHTRSARDIARRELEILGCGCQVNQYMWHGGTNFGFWGSRLNANEASYQTASYDYDAPLAEGGGLTEKYYLTKLVNMLAKHFGQVFAQARMEGPGVTAHSGTSVLNIAGPAGRIAVVTNNGKSEITSATISLPDGKDLSVSLEPLDAVAIPVGVPVGPERVLNYANLMPLGLFGEGVLVLHGPAGWEGRICVNGTEVKAPVPAGETPTVLDVAGQKVVVMNSQLAQRTWEIDGALVIGPSFVGATAEDVVLPAKTVAYSVLSPQGELTQRKAKPAPARRLTPPKLEPFARVCVCDEPINAELTWQRIDRPRDLAALGVEYGYGWYRLDLNRKAGRCNLVLPECEDRATIYLNGKLVGVWGRGEGATREPMGVTFHNGANRLVCLVDNLGRDNFGPYVGANKGLYGHIWDTRPLRATAWKLRPGAEFSRRMVPRMMTHVIPIWEAGPVFAAETTLQMSTVHPVHISYTGFPHHVIVQCNGRQAGFFPESGGHAQVTLTNELQPGNNKLTLLICGQPAEGALDRIRLQALGECVSQSATWWFRKWEPPTEKGRVVGKELPAWYSCRFGTADASVPLFLHMAGAKKGQLYLNGRNLGRFWSIGPQEYYYLPAPWLRADNELMIFEEQGNTPSGSRLEYRPAGPYRE